MLNRQDILEATVMGIVTQGGPSLDDGGNPAYRGNDGCRCALGFLIDDANYDPSLEGFNLDSYSVSGALAKSLPEFDCDDRKFLRELQWAHDLTVDDMEYDDADFWSGWVTRLVELCKDTGLRFPEELV